MEYYEKKYKEALERAKKVHNEHKAQPFNVMLKVFPELAESEDEKLKKELKHYLEVRRCQTNDNEEYINCNHFLAWLENKNSNVDNANKELGESKYNFSIDNSYANTSFPFTAIVKSSNKRVNITAGQLNSDCKYYINYQSDETDGHRIYEPDEIFPELKDDEAERIRKALIDYFDDANKADENPLQSYGIHTDKAISWLERQNEQKLDYTEEDDRNFSLIYGVLKMEKEETSSQNYKEEIDQALEWLENVKKH